MPNEVEKFQADLLESVRQMRQHQRQRVQPIDTSPESVDLEPENRHVEASEVRNSEPR